MVLHSYGPLQVWPDLDMAIITPNSRCYEYAGSLDSTDVHCAGNCTCSFDDPACNGSVLCSCGPI